MCRPSLKLRLYLCLLTAIATMPLSAQSDDPSANYRVLEWKELVPEGWEAPVIAPAYGEASENLVDSASLVGELNGLVVKMPGFLRPVLFNDRSVTEFLLVPFLPHHIKQHAHLEPNQMVYVVLDRPVEIENPFEPLWVTGIISLQTVVTDEGPSGYKIINAEVQEYVY